MDLGSCPTRSDPHRILSPHSCKVSKLVQGHGVTGDQMRMCSNMANKGGAGVRHRFMEERL